MVIEATDIATDIHDASGADRASSVTDALEPTRIFDLVEQGAQHAPDAVALRQDDTEWTYATLHRAAMQAAAEFARRGVVRGDRVLIVADNSLAQVAAFFGAAALGAWPSMLNARSSPREIDTIRDHARPRVIVYTSGTSPEAAAHAARHGAEAAKSLAETYNATLAWGKPDASAEAESGPDVDRVAALIYTSGTTGAPKGVMVTHAGLLNFAGRSARIRRLSPSDLVLGALPLSHIFGCATILLTSLHARASVWLLPRFEAAEAVDALERGRLTVLHGVPTLYGRLVAEMERRDRKGPFPALRYAYVGGGALEPALKRRIEQALALPVHHGYGMTEYAGSMFVTHVDRPRLDALPGDLAPDCEARFVRPDGSDADRGEPGEIWVRGPGTMLGYYRQPELTRATLTPDGWPRTGDLGHLEDDGALRIVGRARDIIKRSGFIVHPLEIEQQLMEHPAVRLAGVVGVAGEDGDERIVAFVEPRAPDDSLDVTMLLQFARERLSPYKCPQHVVQVRELPLTANGKIRKHDLRDLWQARS